ncbi:hypothetical protein Nepgr_022447 [Nepenthes gracilis]|uniref:Anthocyanin 5-aromatic acyltransferase n=1 Tax=Nepenthes gracilis TaxID=150966 RepID=A0AAD3T0U5_NEPGR|nr:hypothetical protein Nepgr_022447 [Nepenthes gracilis]
MAPSVTVNISEQWNVSPPPRSVTPTSLSLTFFDIPWLLFPPSQTIFFYQLRNRHPSSHRHFSTSILPNLKHSLSLSLQHFYPFAGNLVARPETGEPKIVYAEGDSVTVAVAESDADFNSLCGDGQRNATLFHQLVPRELPTTRAKNGDVLATRLLAVQITSFPGDGFCIGLTCHHVVSDGRTFNNFLKTWASFSRDSGRTHFTAGAPPFYDRSVILDPNSLGPTLLKKVGSLVQGRGGGDGFKPRETGAVRATFTMGPDQIDGARRWILAQCGKKNRACPVLLSAYVVACAFVWVCLVRAQVGPTGGSAGNNPTYFGFVAGGITRLGYRVPESYFGNCVAFGRAVAARGELEGEDGILVAADAIGRKVKDLDNDVLGGAEDWISEWGPLIGSDHHVNVVGSPKMDLYKTDFGWSRPRKIEEISIEAVKGVSLTESRGMKGGIEIGVALPRAKMEAFAGHFTQGIDKLLASCSNGEDPHFISDFKSLDIDLAVKT